MPTWQTPLCPFEVAFTPEKLDAIRIAVIDAFYALPRGGLEIGGVLFGKHAADRVTITDYRMIECEHLTGPSFILSDKDKSGLRAMLAATKLEPVGWFHSHTRSGIFLSPQDLELHQQFFPEPWQVALVLRPANLEPVRAGYFFREASGRIQAETTSKEFVLESLSGERLQQPRQSKTAPPQNGRPAPVSRPPENPSRTLVTAAPKLLPDTPLSAELRQMDTRTPIPKRVESIEANPLSTVIPSSRFPEPVVKLPKSRTRTVVLWLAVALLVASVAGFFAMTHSKWADPPPPEPLALAVSDAAGKLLVRWNTSTSTIRNATAGVLTIRDGGRESQIALDSLQLTRGFVLTDRHSPRADVRMKVSITGANPVEEVTSFAGPIIPPAPTAAEIEAQKRAQEIAQQEKKTKADLADQTVKNKALERELKNLREQAARSKQ